MKLKKGESIVNKNNIQKKKNNSREKDAIKINSKNLLNKRIFSIWMVRITFIAKLLFLTLVIAFFSTNLFKKQKKDIKNIVQDYLYGVGFKIDNLIIEGKKNADIDEVLSFLQDRNILLLDIDDLRTNLMQNKFIKEVFVYRKLPDTIQIKIIEKEPFALWQYNNKIFVVDEYGDVLSDQIENFKTLPYVIGRNANLYVSDLLKTLNSYKGIADKISFFVRRGDRRWNLILHEDILLKMPENDIHRALQYVEDLYLSQNLFNKEILYIDLRNSKRYYIKFKNQIKN